MNKCPKCSSTRCTTNDLLPNLSLRMAIEHFLETKPAGGVDFDDPGPIYVPDVESRVEAKEASGAQSIHQQEQNLPFSPSATAKDSNLIPTAKDIKRSSSIRIRLDGNKPAETVPALLEEASWSAHFQGSASFSKVYQNIARESDISGFGAPATRARKGGRTCYRCGSPNHLIRDCPFASNLQSGDNAFHGDTYGPPNWQGSMFNPYQPYGNFYGTPGIVPFDPGVASYMPSFYGAMRNPYTFVGMGCMPSPVIPGVQQPMSHTGFIGTHDNATSQKAPSEKGVREYDYDSSSDDYHDKDGRRMSHKQCRAEKISERHYDKGSSKDEKGYRNDRFYCPAREKHCYSSDEVLADQKYRREFPYGRERWNEYSEQSAYDLHDMPDKYTQDSRQRNEQHQRSALGKIDESRAKRKIDYSENSHNQSRKEKGHTGRAGDGYKSSKKTDRHKHQDKETDHSTDYKRDGKWNVSSQTSRHAKAKPGYSDGHSPSDRWGMGDARQDDNERMDHYHHKKKRNH